MPEVPQRKPAEIDRRTCKGYITHKRQPIAQNHLNLKLTQALSLHEMILCSQVSHLATWHVTSQAGYTAAEFLSERVGAPQPTLLGACVSQISQRIQLHYQYRIRGSGTMQVMDGFSGT